MECDIQGSRKMPKRKSSFSCLDDDDMGGCSIGIVDIGRLMGLWGAREMLSIRGGAQFVEFKLSGRFECTPENALKFTYNKQFLIVFRNYNSLLFSNFFGYISNIQIYF